ncbi:MAG TPA: ComEA family DNA-binding protein [Candidatus Aphodovivens avistercoris]|nr:ComEA family DNA-binding protein [Candidatus Aphodovivens avistercoris]
MALEDPIPFAAPGKKEHQRHRRIAGIGAALACLVLVGIVVGGALLGSAGESFTLDAADAPSLADAEAGADDAAEAEAEPAPAVVVHVSGAVAAPGVYELEEGARVQDALDAAGGASADACPDALNLARVVADGEQVVVPTVEEEAAQEQAGAAGASGSVAGGKVNINTATAEQLDALPGVGPATAEKIIADREANGPFASPEDLKRVSGIGDKKYEELADLVSVG